MSILTQHFFSLRVIKITHSCIQFEKLCIYISPRCKINFEDTHLRYIMRLSLRNFFNMLIETQPDDEFSLLSFSIHVRMTDERISIAPFAIIIIRFYTSRKNPLISLLTDICFMYVINTCN